MRHHTQPSACIWMQAGVVKNKPCFKDFHCQDCRFDQAMERVCRSSSRTLKTKDFVFWQEKLRLNPVARRPCIHHMKGRIDFKACHKSFHCIDCEFDQFFQDQFKVFTRVTPVVFSRIRGVSLPAGYYLSSDHVWVKLEGDNLVSIGVDDFISKIMGPFDKALLPLTGKSLTRDGKGFTLGREKERVSFPSPLSGVITGVNPRALKHPSGIKEAPYTEGWLFTMICNDLKQELKSLMFMEDAAAFMDKETRELYDFLEETSGLAAADGGELGPDLLGVLPKDQQRQLLARFAP